MDTVHQHLEYLLKKSGHYLLTDNDKALIATRGLEKFMFSKLSSKKFRKYKMEPQVISRVEFSIHDAIEKQNPLEVYFFQGGYKLWRLPTSPEPDWAEFFNLAYVLNYVAPLAAAYKPGVSLTYYCHTLLMEKHDNLSTQEIEAYMSGLQNLFDEFLKYLPTNITLRIQRDADIYSREDYFNALESGLKIAEEDMKTWSEEKINDYNRMASLNIKWNGREDWLKLSALQRQEKIRLAAAYEQAAVSNLPKVTERVKAPNLILLFTKSAPIFIGIGSTKTSIAKHWVGLGVLEKDDKGYYERILTPLQFETFKSQHHDVVKTNLINMKNFSEIWVYPRIKLGT